MIGLDFLPRPEFQSDVVQRECLTNAAAQSNCGIYSAILSVRTDHLIVTDALVIRLLPLSY